jgi:predicted nuclease of restriction endonuclease-like (RecB) superfamily
MAIIHFFLFVKKKEISYVPIIYISEGTHKERRLIMNFNNLYNDIFDAIKADINSTRYRILKNANYELVNLYFRLGKIIEDNSKYGNNFVSELSKNLKMEFPDMKGFSLRNLFRMKNFYNEYKGVGRDVEKVPLSMAILPPEVAQLPWSHNYVLIEKVKDMDQRMWYAQKCYENGWTKEMLVYQINSNVFQRQNGSKLHNFENKMPDDKYAIAKEMLKDPYIFKISNVNDRISEREIENEMIFLIKESLLEFGNGFSFVGSQYKIRAGNQDYYIDLLFYHIELRCYIVVELKNSDFKPEYIGQLNFYVTAVNRCLKKEIDNNTIGLLLCRDKDEVSVKWSLEGIDNPIGVSSYEINKYISNNKFSLLPTEEEIKSKIIM